MGAHDFLKTVTRAKISPPIAPRIARPAACSGERVVRFQAQAAVPIAQTSSNPVLLTVPVKVMASPRAMPSPRKVPSFNVGFDVRIRSAIRALLQNHCSKATDSSMLLRNHADSLIHLQLFND